MNRCMFAALIMVIALSIVLPVEAASSTFTGKVLQVLPAGRYTYVEVDVDGQPTWAATPAFVVSIGETVSVRRDMPMRNFFSKELNRKFELVYFVGEIKTHDKSGKAAQKMPKGHPVVAGKGKKDLPELDLSGIKLPKGAISVADAFARKDALSGKVITVHGRVVKFTRQIMGKNWIHLRDGTGAEGSNDLTVTTQAVVKRGDLVTATGTATADKDFGFGYHYAVLLENATVDVAKDQ